MRSRVNHAVFVGAWRGAWGAGRVSGGEGAGSGGPQCSALGPRPGALRPAGKSVAGVRSVMKTHCLCRAAQSTQQTQAACLVWRTTKCGREQTKGNRLRFSTNEETEARKGQRSPTVTK